MQLEHCHECELIRRLIYDAAAEMVKVVDLEVLRRTEEEFAQLISIHRDVEASALRAYTEHRKTAHSGAHDAI